MTIQAAAIAVGIVLISVVGSFVGGYFGARWKAGTDLAQWRRDRLLQFCADFLEAGKELIDFAYSLEEGQPFQHPQDVDNRLLHAWARIRLLSEELGAYALKAQQDISHVLAIAEATGELRQHLDAAIDASAQSYGILLGAAHDVLMDRRIPKLNVDAIVDKPTASPGDTTQSLGAEPP
jgi:hypothetical protein